VTSRL